ncbi:MAG: 30S ribosomal protein THX [Chitinophagales bacterium]|nr:30S ribosomal protein THX [Chitinophagales bacterium]
MIFHPGFLFVFSIFAFLKIKKHIMGRGDKRSRKGKIASGSFGKARPRTALIERKKRAESGISAEKPRPKAKEAAPKKAAPKKATPKKTAPKKTAEVASVEAPKAVKKETKAAAEKKKTAPKKAASKKADKKSEEEE